LPRCELELEQLGILHLGPAGIRFLARACMGRLDQPVAKSRPEPDRPLTVWWAQLTG